MDGLTHLWWRWWSEDKSASLPYACYWHSDFCDVYEFPQPEVKVTCLVCLGTTIT